MYFLRRLRPIEVAGERVRELRVSLNAPVLSTPDLPIGPARAAIVIHHEARGRMDATVGVRSLRSGEAVFWSFDGELRSDDDLSVAGDAALTFAESLGFLFDDAPLGPGAEAEKTWAAWLGGEAPALANAAHAAVEAAESTELLLEEIVVSAEDTADFDPQEIAAAAPPVRSPEPTRSEPLARKPARAVVVPVPAPEPAPTPRRTTPTLSKFRSRREAPASSSASGRQPFAKVQLVKRRSPEEERRLLLRRILTSF